MAFCFFLVLEIVFLSAAVHGQKPSTDGFISIDCGSSNTNYTDSVTNIPYVSDEQFTDTGINHQISSRYVTSTLDKQLLTVRSFPNASRSCYVLRPVTHKHKYLVRAMFMYGDYESKDSSATIMEPLWFDVYIDVNFWRTITVTGRDGIEKIEAIAVALADSISVCLVNTGWGTPFISVLELRPLEDSMYPAANTTQYLDLSFRVNVGQDTGGKPLRYPDDPYDRIWKPWTSPYMAKISTDKTVDVIKKNLFRPPMAVMQTAATTINSSVLVTNWNSSTYGALVNEEYVVFYFSELLPNTSRAFDVYLNGDVWFSNYTPPYLMSGTIYNTAPLTPSQRYDWAFNSSGLSTLPPILNAEELYTPIYLTNLPTHSGDVDAINAIKEQYQVKISWTGDPCAPEQYPWDGLHCSYGTNPPRITAVNLSSNALTGVVASSFAELTAIKYLDLSYNSLTGSIPDALGTLSSLQVLNLTGNNLTGTIPVSLLKRSQQRALTFRYDGNPYLGTDGTSNGSKKKIGTAITLIICVVPVVLVLLLVIVFVVWRVRKSGGSTQRAYARPGIYNFPKPVTGHQDNLLQLENRQFTYKELEKITNRFTNVLGKGGFGTVFLGYLEDGTQVAVKMQSQSSSQGTKEFLAEARNLTKIHHKNLVSLVGYCMDGDHLALVYEFMSQGTLRDHLRGKTRGATALSWGQRLQIAVEAAQGLEYLHNGCRPPLIHRDVKSANILLSESLEAKIADFGLSRAFDNDNQTHISTGVAGTPGYLDPEYYSSHQLSEKSDVYSFGVVLLELITGQPPMFVTDNQSATLAQWVRRRLATGNIQDVVDAKLQSEYDVNSIWKAADVALRCVEKATHRRPTMTNVVMELKESLALESAYHKSKLPSTSKKNICTETTTAKRETSASGAYEVEDFPSFGPSAR